MCSILTEMFINGRKLGSAHNPLVIAEIGINHEGNFDKAIEVLNTGRKIMWSNNRPADTEYLGTILQSIEAQKLERSKNKLKQKGNSQK